MSLAGVVDGFYPDLLHGWAYDSEHPTRPASISLEVNGTIASSFTGDVFRQDLAAANIGTGRYGFSVRPLASFVPGLNDCRVLFSGTDTMLSQGARRLIAPRSTGFPDSTPLIDPDCAWNEPQQIARFYREASVGNLPPANGVHVAGLFNSGTNFVAQLLASNGVFGLGEEDHRLQSKHFPLGVLSRLTRAMSEQGQSRILYVASVRDPFRWIEAMKSRPYEAEFKSLRSPFSIGRMNVEPMVGRGRLAGFRPDQWARVFKARNIVDYWNRYHAEWIEQGMSGMGHAALLRYEDVVAHPCEVVRVLRIALGMADPEQVTVNVRTAKPAHGMPGDFWTAKRKMTMTALGLRLTSDEMSFIAGNLSENVCRYLGYGRRAEFLAELQSA